MSRKDYELIAAAIAEAYAITETTEESVGVSLTRTKIANALENTNERFDRDRFIKATEVHMR